MQPREAAGFVIAHIDREPRYLLLRNARHGTWGPPKGHAEPGESARDTAWRETLEETGLSDLKPIDGFEHVIEYEVKDRSLGSYRKRVRYFLALADGTEFQRSAEHADGGWYTLQEALRLVSYQELQAVLKAADERLREA